MNPPQPMFHRTEKRKRLKCGPDFGAERVSRHTSGGAHVASHRKPPEPKQHLVDVTDGPTEQDKEETVEGVTEAHASAKD